MWLTREAPSGHPTRRAVRAILAEETTTAGQRGDRDPEGACALTFMHMSGLDTSLENGGIDGDQETAAGRAKRVLVVFEQGASGMRALREAAEMAEAGAEVSVVTLAPQARPLRCCGGGGAGPYNQGVRCQAKIELRDARKALGSVAARTTFTVLAGCPDPPLTAWVAEHEFDRVILSRHRLTRGGSHLARGLRQATAAEIRLVR